MSPFTPKGEKARWRILYDQLRTVETNDVLTYEAMAEGLDLHPEDDRHTMQLAIRRAAKEHEVEDRRAIEVVPNVGYRVVEAEEHMRLAKGQRKRAGRSLARGQSKVVNVDFSAMEPEARKAFEVMAHAFAAQIEFNARIGVRQKRLEDVVDTISDRTDRTESELEALRERLGRLEQ